MRYCFRCPQCGNKKEVKDSQPPVRSYRYIKHSMNVDYERELEVGDIFVKSIKEPENSILPIYELNRKPSDRDLELYGKDFCIWISESLIVKESDCFELIEGSVIICDNCNKEMVRDFASEGMKFGMGLNSSKQSGNCADYDDGEIWRYKQGLPTDKEAARNANMSRAECQKLKPKYKRKRPKYYAGGVKGE